MGPPVEDWWRAGTGTAECTNHPVAPLLAPGAGSTVGPRGASALPAGHNWHFVQVQESVLSFTTPSRRLLWTWASLCVVVVAVLAVLVRLDGLGGMDKRLGDAAFYWTAPKDLPRRRS